VLKLFPWAKDYLAVYERFGLVDARSVLAHNLHPTDDELQTACGQQSNRLALSLQQRSAGQRMVSIASPHTGRCALRPGDRRGRRDRLWLAERRAPGLHDAAARARRLPDRPSALTLSGNGRWGRSSGT